MTQDGLEAPIGPVLGGPRSTRERVRIAAVAVVAVIVLGAGIGLAGNGFTSSPPPASTAGGASAAASDGTASAEPSAESTLPSPTQDAGLGCAPVRLGAPPEFRLQSVSGDGPAVAGVPSANAPNAPSATPRRPVPDVATAIHLRESDALLMASDGNACVRYVVADYAPADPTLTGPFPIDFRTLNVTPLRSTVPLGSLPAGDWVVRVVAYYSTGIAGQEDSNVVERFFRVIAGAGAGAGPLPTPAVSPAVTCAAGSTAATPPSLILAGLPGGPVEGVEPGTGAPPNTHVALGDPVEIRVDGDRCALSWSIGGQSIDGNQQFDLDSQANPTSDPFQFAQNRWPLLGLPTGLDLVTATVRFSADVSISRRWAMIVTAPSFPDARFVAVDGSSVDAVAGCGSTWTFPDGSGGYETCPTSTLVGTPDTLAPPAGTPVRVEVPGWTIFDWSGSCGRLDALEYPADPFVIVNGCDLGHSVEPNPVTFLPRASSPVVRIIVTLRRDDGVIVIGLLYATIVAVPPA